MAGNTVKLTFVGDSTSLDRSFKKVGAEAESVSHQLKDVSGQAKALKTTMRGAGDAAQLFGGQLGANALQAGYALAAVKDLTKGLAGLRISSVLAATGIGAVVAAIATAGVSLAAHIDHTSMANEVSRTFNDSNYYLAAGISTLTAKIPWLGAATDSWRDKADAASQAAHGWTDELGRLEVQAINTGNAAGVANSKVAAMTAKNSAFGPYKTGYKFDSNNPGYQDLVYSRIMMPPKASAAAATKIRGAGNTIADAAKAAAEKIKQARKSLADAMGGIVKALAGQLSAKDADTAGTLEHQLNGTFALEGGQRGASLLEKLKKQAKDTKKLARDLKALAKMGLDKGLLSQLVAGGLDSLPAAEELLRGGKADINTANVLNAQIQGNAGNIAVAEANRNLNKSARAQVDINIQGGDGDLAKLLAKWIRNNGAASLGLKAA